MWRTLSCLGAPAPNKAYQGGNFEQINKVLVNFIHEIGGERVVGLDILPVLCIPVETLKEVVISIKGFTRDEGLGIGI